jgi:hypothetical protein
VGEASGGGTGLQERPACQNDNANVNLFYMLAFAASRNFVPA